VGKRAVRHILLERRHPLPVDAVVRYVDLRRVPGGILEDGVPGGVGDGQDAAGLVQRNGQTIAIKRRAEQAKAGIIGIVARVDDPVEIMDRDDQWTVEPVRDDIEGGVEDIKALQTEKRA